MIPATIHNVSYHDTTSILNYVAEHTKTLVRLEQRGERLSVVTNTPTKSFRKGVALVRGDGSPGIRFPLNSDDHKRRLSEARRNRVISYDTRQKTSETLRRIGPQGNLVESTCPRCGKTGKGAGMIRFHFENCRKIQ